MNERRAAVLVSMSASDERSDPNWPHELDWLECPPRDVDGLADAFEDVTLGGFSKVVTLKGMAHYDVLTAINEELNSAKREDLVLIYYSGHGRHSRAGKLHLATANTRLATLEATSIPFFQLAELIKGSACHRIIVILDCCFSGLAGAEARGGVEGHLKEFSAVAGPGKGIFIMTATARYEVAIERKGDKYSAFTGALIDGISNGAADLNGDGLITVDEIFTYVATTLRDTGIPHTPTYEAIGATGPLVIARSERTFDLRAQLDSIRDTLKGYTAAQLLPLSIEERANEILDALATTSATQETRANPQFGLLKDLSQQLISLGVFIEQWYRINSGLPARNKKPIQKENRWDVARRVRGATFDLMGPAYLLDDKYHFIDWNPAFDEIIAKPLHLIRGRHCEEWVLALANSTEVIERSVVEFGQGNAPLVHKEVLEFESPQHGLIRFMKMASQIPDDAGNTLAWAVELDILSAPDETSLWEDIYKRMKREVNWSMYAVTYDRMLLRFSEYAALTRTVVGMVGSPRVCADLACGTGNGTLELLRDHAVQKVYALDANERMLEYFREKIPMDADDRVVVVKGDLAHSLREFNGGTFDAAIMINALYAMDDPQRCLLEVYRVLKPEGVLALSTSKKDTDVDRLFAAIRDELRVDEAEDVLRRSIDSAERRHWEMHDRIVRDSHEDIRRYVESAGFEIVEWVPYFYVDAVAIVKAVKRTGSSGTSRCESIPRRTTVT